MLLRWTIFNTVSAFIAAYLIYFYDAYTFITTTDLTHVTSVILFTYILTSFGVLYGILKTGGDSEWFRHNYSKPLGWFGPTFMGMGIAGTVVGIMMASSVLEGFDPNNLIPIIREFAAAFSTAPICTVFGVVAAMLLSAQLAFVARQYE